ncbi:MAG: sigma-54-dependent Fis family transcriptional regulator [Colwellia sp.]|nr:sigma-54-dependent Fis family transcriptional regulator [Colwellia sp.]
MNILLSWLGSADIKLMEEDKMGALASIALSGTVSFDKIIILSNAWDDKWHGYSNWLNKKLAIVGRPYGFKVHRAHLISPIDYASITKVTNKWLEELVTDDDTVYINLSSGTPAMTAVSVLLGKGVYNCKFFQSSKENKVEQTQLPIDFSATYKKVSAARIANSSANKPKLESAFSSMVANSKQMQELLYKANKLSQSDLPTLVFGETGTGKEMLSKAIHQGSLRSSKPFKAVNCGALPENLTDSILFGHSKGAFTGADKDHQGLFEQADGGTLFLDEIGELSLTTQVKMLRALQQGEITRVGDTKTRKVDVRIIAATHRDLMLMVNEGTFRENLFYRIAVGVVKLPALRHRNEDIDQLTDEILKAINNEAAKHPDFERKNISESAKLFIKNHRWPGNIRELWSTLSRAVLWSENSVLSVEDIKQSLLERPNKNTVAEVDLSDIEEIDIEQHIDNIRKSYLQAALDKCAGSKSKTAKLLKINNHQTISNWIKKYALN